METSLEQTNKDKYCAEQARRPINYASADSGQLVSLGLSNWKYNGKQTMYCNKL